MNYKVRSGIYNVVGHGSIIVDLLDEDDSSALVIAPNPSNGKGYQPFRIYIHADIDHDGYLKINAWKPNHDEACIIDGINKIAKESL